MINFRKTIAIGLAVTTLGMGVAATSTPAAAWGYHPWGWGIGGVAAGLALGAAPPLPLPITTAAIPADATSPVSRSSTPTAISSAITACVFATKARGELRNWFRQFLPKTSGGRWRRQQFFEAAFGSWKFNLAQHCKRKKTYEARLNLT